MYKNVLKRQESGRVHIKISSRKSESFQSHSCFLRIDFGKVNTLVSEMTTVCRGGQFCLYILQNSIQLYIDICSF